MASQIAGVTARRWVETVGNDVGIGTGGDPALPAVQVAGGVLRCCGCRNFAPGRASIPALRRLMSNDQGSSRGRCRRCTTAGSRTVPFRSRCRSRPCQKRHLRYQRLLIPLMCGPRGRSVARMRPSGLIGNGSGDPARVGGADRCLQDRTVVGIRATSGVAIGPIAKPSVILPTDRPGIG